MTEVKNPADGEFEAAHSKLNEGLKTCRSVVDTYRSLLSPEQSPQAEEEADEGSADPAGES